MALIQLEVELDSTGAIKGIKGLSKKLDDAGKQVSKTSETMVNSLKVAGASIAAFFTVRAVVDFTKQIVIASGEIEKGFIGVAKTTGLAGKELTQLEDSIKDMSTRLAGLTVSDLQDIAETAGQLGISGVDNISSFTETVAKFAAVTDLTADEASRAFAQISNVMGLPIDQSDKLGSVINELSNTTVATARDITDLGLRLAGAGKTIGLTTAEVAAFAATLRDTGSGVEVGGTAMSQIFNKLLLDTEKFAKVANVNFNEFSELIKNEPLDAIRLLLVELNKLDKSAKAEAIKALGLEGARSVGVISKLSEGIDKLDKNLFQEFDTASQGLFAQLTKTANAIQLTAAELGDQLAPDVIKASDEFREELLPILQDLTAQMIDALLPILTEAAKGFSGLIWIIYCGSFI
jgi:TP901 family phage tail tape measure protein